ncbi:interferon regulatory factor 2-like isoform X2 [Scleropages formosus]|uniref:Interferon regulatory factor 2b n=1 Tax=Scleropages formosus TaxID=113540 RepID=A0A8C9S3C1_SCLFO|nr:interferon regulatory factor 2-like isoform X2 [Scleropages formosus]
MPIERMRMRPWLEEQINSNEIPGLKWIDKEKKIFQIPWMHAARHGWDVEKDAPLFRKWAVHTGKYQPGVDKPDPKTWKANFRCAMNSLPDIEEVKDKSMKKGTNAFRVYKILVSSERHSRKGKKKAEKEEKGKISLQGSWSQPVKAGHAGAQVFKEGSVVDSTVLTDPSRHPPHSPEVEHLAFSELPDVGQTIEVITEDEEQSVSSSHPYPLQISPISSCTESDTDSIHGEENGKKGLCDTWGLSLPEGKPLFSNPRTTPPTCPLPSMATFVTSGKAGFSVTSSREASLLSPYTTWNYQAFEAVPFPSTSDQAPAHEARASVIMKTSDASKSTVKSC